METLQQVMKRLLLEEEALLEAKTQKLQQTNQKGLKFLLDHLGTIKQVEIGLNQLGRQDQLEIHLAEKLLDQTTMHLEIIDHRRHLQREARLLTEIEMRLRVEAALDLLQQDQALRVEVRWEVLGLLVQVQEAAAQVLLHQEVALALQADHHRLADEVDKSYSNTNNINLAFLDCLGKLYHKPTLRPYEKII